MVAPSPDFDRRHQHAVRADARAVPDHRPVLVRAVVVGRDRSRAVIDAALRPSRRRCTRGDWPCCHAPSRARLHLDEIADVHLVGQRRFPDACVRRARCGIARRSSHRRDASTARCASPRRPSRCATRNRGRSRTSSPSVTSPSNTQPMSMRTSRPQRARRGCRCARDRRCSRPLAHQRARRDAASGCARRRRAAPVVDAAHVALVVRDAGDDGHALARAPSRRCP